VSHPITLWCMPQKRCVGSSQRATLSTQIQALESLFNATKGDQWRWKNEAMYGPKWSFTSPQADPCNDQNRVWQGINCTSSPNSCKLQPCEIISLLLNAYNLNGSLPSEFFLQLTTLKTLELTSRGLVGEIPSEIGSLSQLERLYFDINQLTGTIPSEISSLTQLERLYFDNNQLTGTIPSEIGSLRVGVLSLYDNHFTGTIPPEIGS
jgi:Leucine-rich repeat (LRR) protein